MRGNTLTQVMPSYLKGRCYDTQCDIAQWVPVWGASASLTMMELHAANNPSNMVPSPYSKVEPVRPLSPEIIKGIPAGAKSDTGSSGVEDSRDKWDKTEVGVWSCCPTPMAKVGPTWVEVHTAAQEEEMIKNQDPTWEDIVIRQVPGGAEEGSQPAVEPQFEDAPVAEEANQEGVMVESVLEETLEQSVVGEPLVGKATMGPGSQDVVQIHTGEDDL